MLSLENALVVSKARRDALKLILNCLKKQIEISLFVRFLVVLA